MSEFEFAAFISHATEDKASVAEPLAKELRTRGLKIWTDVGELRAGDSLREKIDAGLRQSAFGVLVLSPRYFQRLWTNRELDGLMALEHSRGRDVIIPVWHQVTLDDVIAYSPMIASRLALSTANGIGALADHIEDRLKHPDDTVRTPSNAGAGCTRGEGRAELIKSLEVERTELWKRYSTLELERIERYAIHTVRWGHLDQMRQIQSRVHEIDAELRHLKGETTA